MALVKPAMEAVIQASMTAAYGAPTDPASQAKFATALADALFTILTTQTTVSVTVASGSSSGVHPGVLL